MIEFIKVPRNRIQELRDHVNGVIEEAIKQAASTEIDSEKRAGMVADAKGMSHELKFLNYLLDAYPLADPFDIDEDVARRFGWDSEE